MLSSLRSLVPRMTPSSKNPATRFQTLSDLHLEVGQQYATFRIPPTAPYLILAGDVGRLIDYDNFLGFFQRQVQHYKLVFWVLGNHEFYSESLRPEQITAGVVRREMTYTKGIAEAQRMEAEPSLKGRMLLLHKRRYDLPPQGEDDAGITILGCSLWSHVPDDKADKVAQSINDFDQIKGGWTVTRHNAVHADEVTWLKQQMAVIKQEQEGRKSTTKPILIITHHAPTMDPRVSAPEHEKGDNKYAFQTDVLGTSDVKWAKLGVKTWVSGHTHHTNSFEERGVILVSNQRGYVFGEAKLAKEKEALDEVHLTKGKKEYDVGRVVAV